MADLTSDIHPQVRQQLTTLDLDSERPLIISDADEVLLHFASHFREYISSVGWEVDFRSYALLGNIRHQSSKERANREQIMELVEGFFAIHVEKQTPVEGAATALKLLANQSQIVILTNVPYAHHPARIRSMKKLDMDYPLIANRGLKGPVVRHLADQIKAPVFFIDDIDHHHTSVADCAPDVYRLHFIADGELAAMAKPAPDSHHRCDQWPEAAALLQRELISRGF